MPTLFRCLQRSRQPTAKAQQTRSKPNQKAGATNQQSKSHQTAIRNRTATHKTLLTQPAEIANPQGKPNLFPKRYNIVNPKIAPGGSRVPRAKCRAQATKLSTTAKSVPAPRSLSLSTE